MDSRYDVYREWVSEVVKSSSLDTFKYSPNWEYNKVVEHRDYEWGEAFYMLLQEDFGLSSEAILDFCKKNDAKGNPERIEHSFGSYSANSLKYVYHAHLILKHMKELGKSSVSVVEIGGGYGGLALALLHYAPTFAITIQEYNLIDFEEVLKLQQLYLQEMIGNTSIFKFHNAMSYGDSIEGENHFLIGIYSIGEFLETIQTQYIETLFPKVAHGFLIWNEKPRDLPKACVRLPERPLTGPHNHFVYF